MNRGAIMDTKKPEPTREEVGMRLTLSHDDGSALTPVARDRSPQASIGQSGSAKTVVIAVVCLMAAGIAGAFLYLQPDHAPAAPPKKAVDVAATKARAEAGDVRAQKELGDVYAEGNGVPLSFAEAARWYRLSADRGNAAAANSLGMLYDVGQGVAHDESEAVKWYRKAAEQGDIGGEYNLGLMYGDGRGVPHNATEAAKWHRLAAEQGDALAQFNMGKRCYVGKGVTQDFVEAYKWLSLAAAQGIPDAVELLKEVKPNMSSADIVEARKRLSAFIPKKAVFNPAK